MWIFLCDPMRSLHLSQAVLFVQATSAFSLFSPLSSSHFVLCQFQCSPLPSYSLLYLITPQPCLSFSMSFSFSAYNVMHVLWCLNFSQSPVCTYRRLLQVSSNCVLFSWSFNFHSFNLSGFLSFLLLRLLMVRSKVPIILSWCKWRVIQESS